MIERRVLVEYLDEYLAVAEVEDYCPNGLQVEGREEIRKVATGVTACQALFDAALEWGADAVLVHHGLFWRSTEMLRVVRSMRQRLASLLCNEVTLLAYHLPLDRHPEVGNNAVLARLLDVAEATPAFVHGGVPIGLSCRLAEPVPAEEMFARITRVVGREPLIIPGGPAEIRSLGIVSGADPASAAEAARSGHDLFLTGEPSEPMVHLAREEGLHFVAAGHHATERFGVRALGEHLAEHFGLEVRFIDIDNPV